MNSQQTIALFEEVGVITGQMLTAARSGDWDQLAELESVCAGHIDTLRRDSHPETLSEDLRTRKGKIIGKILADDREIRDLLNPWMTRLSAMMNSAGTERRLARAYGA